MKERDIKENARFYDPRTELSGKLVTRKYHQTTLWMMLHDDGSIEELTNGDLRRIRKASQVEEMVERIVCGGNVKNLTRLDKSGAQSMGESAARGLHDSLLQSARFLSGESKRRGYRGEVEDYMEVMLDEAMKELTKLKRRY